VAGQFGRWYLNFTSVRKKVVMRRGFLIDIDGVIYRGGELIAGATGWLGLSAAVPQPILLARAAFQFNHTAPSKFNASAESDRERSASAGATQTTWRPAQSADKSRGWCAEFMRHFASDASS
jgi:hypothetical protein